MRRTLTAAVLAASAILGTPATTSADGMQVGDIAYSEPTTNICTGADTTLFVDGTIRSRFATTPSGHVHVVTHIQADWWSADGASGTASQTHTAADFAPAVPGSDLVAHTTVRFRGRDGEGNVYLNRYDFHLRLTPDGPVVEDERLVQTCVGRP
jgi:hypothetical protein